MHLFWVFAFRHFGTPVLESLDSWLLHLPITETLKWSLRWGACFGFFGVSHVTLLVKEHAGSPGSNTGRTSGLYLTFIGKSQWDPSLHTLILLRFLCIVFPKDFWSPPGTSFLYSRHHCCCTFHQWQAYTACKTCQQSPPLALMATKAPKCAQILFSPFDINVKEETCSSWAVAVCLGGIRYSINTNSP